MIRRNTQQNQGRANLAVTIAELQAALDEGWTIDPPVERLRIPDQGGGNWYCHIILWRQDRVRVLTVPDDPSLRQLLTAHGIESVEKTRL